MQLARVMGEVVATIKDANLGGSKLLVLQPIDFQQQPIRWVVIALDCTPGGGAGVGSTVMFVEGREAANPFENPPLPVDACVTGIVDSWEYPQAGKAEG